MTVVHDSSGCNSTYSTFDEPRWYDRESLIFITGLTETEAIFGREDRLLDNVAAAAAEFRPAFVALCGSPMPFILGTDYAALASELEERCGLPVLGLPTTGIRRARLDGPAPALLRRRAAGTRFFDQHTGRDAP